MCGSLISSIFGGGRSQPAPKVTAKKVAKKGTKGTSQLATQKPATGGLQGINTPQGVNTSSGGGGGTTKP